MSKPIYKSQKPYSQDINDLVDADIMKGGKGSGIKGHITSADAMHHDRMTRSFQGARKAMLHFEAQRKDAANNRHHENNLKEVQEHYRQKESEARGHVQRHLNASTADQDRLRQRSLNREWKRKD